MVLRFLCHFVSGITIWTSFDVYNNPWIYSLVYNVVYMLPEMLICLGAAGLLFSTKKSREFLLSNQ
jgi:thiamine transporter